MADTPDFDIDRFEQRVESLMAAYQGLLSEHRALQAAHESHKERDTRLRERLNSVIERIRALEAEAESA